MAYFFDLEDFETTCRALGDAYLKSINQDNLENKNNYYQKYGTYDGYKPSQETIVLNDDGSISFFPTSGGYGDTKVKESVDYGGYCCVKKLPFIMEQAKTSFGVFEGVDTTAIYWDAENQSCRWKKQQKQDGSCVLDTFKIVLNAVDNDGATFNVGTGEKDCTLDIDFNYLFKLDCQNLADILNSSISNDPKLDAQILALNNAIEKEKVKCSQWGSELQTKSKDFEASSYSIAACGTVPFAYGKTAAALYATAEANDIYCINEENGGLTQWLNILGPSRYKRFLDGVVDSYTCDDFNTIFNINNQFIRNNQPPILTKCTTPFGYKSNLKKNIDAIVQRQKECNANITKMEAELKALNTKSEVINPCATPIDVLETLDVSIVLDVVNSDGSLTTVYESQLFEPIGTGNLYEYLKDRPFESGFYLCGEPADDELWASGCTVLRYNDELTGPTAPFSFDCDDRELLGLPADFHCNVTSCRIAKDAFLKGLYGQSGLSNSTTDRNTFKASLSKDIFASKWLSSTTTIDDVDVLDKIKNKKIKLSLKINNTCSNICVYLDNIKLNRTCIDGNGQSVLIAQSPGFHLERIIDNKKSWIKNSTRVNREFNIANNQGQNIIRKTDYDVNDERLVINTKEIDLDINIASAIENDVQCYINDNLGLLDSVPSNDCGCSESLPCYEDVFKIIPYAEAVDSGLIPSPIDPQDFLATAREVRNAWLKAWNELNLASGPYLDIVNGVYTPHPNQDVADTYRATRDSYLKALHEFNLAAAGGYIEGLTIDEEFTDGNGPMYTQYKFSMNEELAPQMFNTKCGRIFKTNTENGYMYFVETPTKELKVFWANEDFGPRNTTWIDMTSLVQENYPTNWNFGSYTPERASYFCKKLVPVNYPTWTQMRNFHYKTNGNTSHNDWIYPVEDSFFIEWDDKKGKCMTNMFKEVVPEQFSMHYPITSLNLWTNYSTPSPIAGETPQCVLDIYLRNSATTACTSVDFTWPTISEDIDTIYRRYRDANLKLSNEIKLTERTPRHYVYVIDPVTKMKPDETSGKIPVKVTTTIRKGSTNGDIVFKEEYVLNDSTSTCQYRFPDVSGLTELSVFVGITDPNSAYWNPNAEEWDFINDCSSSSEFGTLLSGNTSTLPLAGASNNATDRNWRFDEDYYVHFDVVNNNTNYVYEVTNNDYNLKDRPMPIVCPSSASTQTLNINSALNSINTHKTKMLSNIQADLNHALSICTNC